MSTLRTAPQRPHRGAVHLDDCPTLEVLDASVLYEAAQQGGNGQGGPQYALEKVSFRLERGEQVAVVGPNGAGKSTLFKVLVGTLKPTSGEVLMCGHSPDEHICIAYVPQRSQIDWSFPATVEDVVMMGRVGRMGLFRRPRRRDREVVQASLERVGATGLAKKQIGELSGGQQQRVFIARSLAQEAELLLLDEPLSGLDLPSQQAIFEILDSLRSDGVTVMMATHDLNLAAERFDRVMLLNRRIVAFGPAESALSAERLIEAYGEQLHQLGADRAKVLADTCCQGHEHDHGTRADA